MRLSDLKTGMIVTTRDGEEFVVFLNCCVPECKVFSKKGYLSNIEINSWIKLDSFNDEMKCMSEVLGNSLDIVKVEVPFHPYSFQNPSYEKDRRKLLWQEESEIKEVTMSEVEEKFGCKVKIVGG